MMKLPVSESVLLFLTEFYNLTRAVCDNSATDSTETSKQGAKS